MVELAKKTMIETLIKSGQVKDLQQGKENKAGLAKRLFVSFSKEEIAKLYNERIGKAPEQTVDEIISTVNEIKKSTKKSEAKKTEPAKKAVKSKKIDPLKAIKTAPKKKETPKAEVKVAKKPKVTKKELHRIEMEKNAKLRAEAKAKKEQERRAAEQARLAAMSKAERAMYKEGKDAAGNVYPKAWIPQLLDKAKFKALAKGVRTLKGSVEVQYTLKEDARKKTHKGICTFEFNYETNSITVFDSQKQVVQYSKCLCEFMIRRLIEKYAGISIEAPKL